MPVDDESAIEQYIKQVERKTTVQKPYDRLMIYYRKKKQLAQELAIINKAIVVFSRKEGGKTSTAAVKRLSKSIGQAIGLIDKTGKQTYVPGPVQQWMKRKKIVTGKIAAFAKTKKKYPCLLFFILQPNIQARDHSVFPRHEVVYSGYRCGVVWQDQD